ncbi:hypothetical protein NPIL_96051 [Nephila pilipes]|uniref:Uncharacterized protein n=1 Tax=Nephila pilipes TaxID=299642 RepID=A0A8X6QVE7_NEPPI|nr:hypothetical protein NPIL_96051 [Nephila pilipes]
MMDKITVQQSSRITAKYYKRNLCKDPLASVLVPMCLKLLNIHKENLSATEPTHSHHAVIKLCTNVPRKDEKGRNVQSISIPFRCSCSSTSSIPTGSLESKGQK